MPLWGRTDNFLFDGKNCDLAMGLIEVASPISTTPSPMDVINRCANLPTAVFNTQKDTKLASRYNLIFHDQRYFQGQVKQSKS